MKLLKLNDNFISLAARLLLTLSPLCCCSRQAGDKLIDGLRGGVTVSLSVESDRYETRGRVFPDEDRIDDINVLVYSDNGRLYTSYFGDPASCSFVLSGACSYGFFILANYGSAIAGPPERSGLSSFTLEYRTGEHSGASVPMAGCEEAVRIGSGGSVSIRVRRLFAKVGVRIDESMLSTASYQYKSLTLKQCPTHILPWGESFAETVMTCDGDSASEAEMSAITETECYFYVPENLRGKLLENSDPWLKSADNLDIAHLLPYVELCASYSDHGLSDENTKFRFYPGANDTDNFDIRRNHMYHITVRPSDEGIFRGSWKLEAENMSNARRISISPSDFRLNRLLSRTLTIEVEPSGLPYELVYDADEWTRNGVSMVRDGDRLVLSSAYTGTVPLDFSIEARDREGLTTTCCRFTVEPAGKSLLIPDKTELDVWGGNSYPLRFIYKDGNGLQQIVMNPVLDRVITDGGMPAGYLTCFDNKLIARDWWGGSGDWTENEHNFEAHFSYRDAEAVVRGKIRGHAGFGDVTAGTVHYRDIVRGEGLALETAQMRGAVTTDVRSGVISTVIKKNGRPVEGMTATWNGPYLKMGDYTAECTFTDPSNGLERSCEIPLPVISNIRSVSGTLHFTETVNGSPTGASYSGDFDTGTGGNMCQTGISLPCDLQQTKIFRVHGTNLQYIDSGGNPRDADQYDEWTGADLLRGIEGFGIDSYTGAEYINLILNGYQFSLGYGVNQQTLRSESANNIGNEETIDHGGRRDTGRGMQKGQRRGKTAAEN